MKTAHHPSRSEWEDLLQRPDIDRESLENVVNGILQQVKTGGDHMLRELTEKYDRVTVGELKITPDEIAAAEKILPGRLKNAIEKAAGNIETFHAAQQEKFSPVETAPGVRCWRKSVPVENVGLYIPGGTAPLFSTVLMLGIPARLAGCRNIVLCTPPGKEGRIHPAILYAARVAGVTDIFRAGGAQAIAAMASGTESVPKVDKIFGPGNRYVTAAKMLVQREGVAIDMPAGPSEVLVFADETCVPSFVASDLLSQAEHDEDAQVVLLTTSEKVLVEVNREVEHQLQSLPRQQMLRTALSHSVGLLLKDAEEALEAINFYAPEHLILACRDAESMADRIVNAGSVFIGNFTPESAGDYASGTNHTLPTNGYAKSYSGVSLDSFLKKITFQQISREGLHQLGPVIMTLAEAEQLPAHARAVALRIQGG